MALIGEYRTMVHKFKLDVESKDIDKDVQDELNRYCLDLPRFVGGLLDSDDWKMNSHSLALMGNRCLLTIFLERKTK